MMVAEKVDKGFLIMEDLKNPQRPKEPLKELDKSEICKIHIAKLVLQKMATFHGVWFSWLKNQDPPVIGGLNKGQLMEALSWYSSKDRDLNIWRGGLK